MKKQLIITFEASEDSLNYDIDGLNFIYISATAYNGDNVIGDCCLKADGDIEVGTQEGIFKDEYTVNTLDYDKIVYHNNEDGKEYDVEQFIVKFCENDTYKMIGMYATISNIYTESVSCL